MARTIRTKVFKFSELSEAAKQKAIESYRNDGIDVSYIYDEAHESIKAFNELFGTDEGSRSWLDVRTSNIDDNICSLSGNRLRTYIINNFSWKWTDKIRFSKHIDGSFQKSEWRYKYDCTKYRVSKIAEINNILNCPLTGVCYDNSLLQPIADFIKKPDTYTTFESLMSNCVNELRKDLENEENYRNSDEAIREDIQANDYEFFKDGSMSTL